MAKRRGDGEGSIYRCKDGRWRAEVSVGYKPNGRPHRKVLYGKTRAALSDKLTKALEQKRQGFNIRPEKQTIEEFLNSWLDGTVRPKNREQTQRSYGWIVRTHLIPGIGSIQLEKLTPQLLQNFLNERHASGLSSNTVRHIRATIRSALSQAERWGIVSRNVAKLVSIPRGQKFEPTVLTPEQAQAFLTHLLTHPREALYATAITMGLRRGELLGLRWQDVDLEKSQLHVCNALHRIKGAGLVLRDLKTAKSRRRLTIPQITLAALVRWRVTQQVEKQWAGESWQELDYVFTNTLGGPLNPEAVTHELGAILAAAKLPKVRMHDLRHSCASLLLSLGVHPKLVQETLGHSTFQLTMDTYSHMIPALRNEVADRMDTVFSPTPTNAPTKNSTGTVN